MLIGKPRNSTRKCIFSSLLLLLFLSVLFFISLLWSLHGGSSGSRFNTVKKAIDRPDHGPDPAHSSIPCIVRIHVISRPTNFNQRQDIRLTWGATARKLGMQVRFLMTTAVTATTARSEQSEQSWIDRAVTVEQERNHDLIRIESPTDQNVRNMAFVIAGGLKTYTQELETGQSTCRYFMKIDSDIFLRPSKLLHVLERAENKTKKNKDEGNGQPNAPAMLYMGHIWLKGRVVRDKTSPWYITGGVIEALGKHTTFYPPYASGKAYILSSNLAQKVSNGCFSPATINAGPEDAQLGLCVDQMLKTDSSADIVFVRSKSFDTNHCDGQSAVVEITTPGTATTAFSSSVSSSSIGVLYHAHTVNLAGESLCNILHPQESTHLPLPPPLPPQIVIAITSSLKSFEVRAKAITRTWGTPMNLNKHRAAVRFFVGEDVKQQILEISDRLGIGHDQVVALPGVVDDEYPPVLKNTAMLTTLHTMLASMSRQYDWVLKVDDDTLVNFQGLQFLAKFNPLVHKLYLGQQGTGIPADRGKLGIIKPFCMGGPGYVISRAALNVLGPQLIQCAQKKMSRKDHSWHSDVIVGLCMEEHVHIGCWDHDASAVVKYRPLKRFFHKYDFLQWPLHNELVASATLHPLKNPLDMREKYQSLVQALRE